MSTFKNSQIRFAVMEPTHNRGLSDSISHGNQEKNIMEILFLLLSLKRSDKRALQWQKFLNMETI